MDKKTEAAKPVIQSNRIVIQAADAALAAVDEVFDGLYEDDRWLSEKVKKAALEAALASIVTI